MSLSTCAELSRCFAAAASSPKPNSAKSNVTTTLRTPVSRYGGVLTLSRKNNSMFTQVSKGLTYRDAGVDIDAGTELVRRIAKMAPGIGGFGGVLTLSRKNNSMFTQVSKGLTYRDAGVDIDAGTELVRRIAKMAPGIGGFGGLFPLGDSYLVAGTDGVGTKLMLAFETGIHDTIGIDLVAMSVNDIVTSGAKPLFFLDYFATGRLDVDVAEKVIKGIVDGCKQSDCVLLGGETAEMPGLYKEGEYDLSGCAVGIVDKDSVINGKNIVAGDVLIGLPSSGVHSNGFSLVRRVLVKSGLSLKDQLPGSNITLAEALMAPTVIYVKQVLDLVSKGGVKGMAHITGGGFTDNIPRVFPKGLGAVIYNNSWEVPAVFNWLQETGEIEDFEMRRTFNMGIGMVLVVSPEAANRILENRGEPEKFYRVGEVISGNGVTFS